MCGPSLQLPDMVGNYDLARNAYSEALRLAPENAEFHHSQGHVLLKLLQNEEALEEYTQAIHLEQERTNNQMKNTNT